MSVEAWRRTLRSEEETLRLAETLGRAARGGDVLGLVGPLGAGKTRFVQGIAAGLDVGVDDAVLSPTFALVHEHVGRLRLVHVDLYRLERAEDLTELGLRDYFVDEDTVTCIEWMDRFEDVQPDDWLEVRIEMGRGTRRTFMAVAHGPRSRAWLARVER